MADTSKPQLAQLALSYFQAPQPYFWHWAEQGEVVEWDNGTTICYREELVRLLEDLAPNGLPSLGTLLLVLAACTAGWSSTQSNERVMYSLLLAPGVSHSLEQTQKMMSLVATAADFLKAVAGLPSELRTGPKKLQLLHEIFTGEYRQVPADWAQGVVNEWASGRLDAQLQNPGPAVTRQRYEVDLALLSRAQQRFPTKESLVLKLRTGLDQLPEPQESPPLPPAPDVLGELAADAKTAGLARLARRLVATLNIPLHAQGASDQPYGGVSDVTNRGSFDRLLLSELAHDDLTLTARLVNNEALYLRREEPPHQEQRHRVLLLDTTLRMWGVPRVFALAAALASANTRRPTVSVTAYALGGQQAQPLELTTKAGVGQALSYLDPALHCGAALQAFVREQPLAAHTECILFTDAQLVQSPEFNFLLSELKSALRFLVLVDRSGELQLFEFTKAGRILVGTSYHDLNELLFAPPRLPAPTDSGSPPAFLGCSPAPLLFPANGLRPSVGNTFQHGHSGVVGITDAQRVLFWPKKEQGARELLSFIESGTYTFGFDGQSTVYVLVSNSNRKLLHFHRFSLTDQTTEFTDFSAEIQALQSTLEVYFTWPHYTVRVDLNAHLIDCRSGTVIKRTYFNHADRPTPTLFRPDFNSVKRHINNGYSVFQKISRIAVDGLGLLAIEGHSLQLINDDRLKLANKAKDNNEHSIARANAEPYTLPSNEKVQFRRLAWPDGSQAVVDSRGLLHLRSSDAELPEITLVLVLGQATAAWASDGVVTGSAYFTGSDLAKSLPANEFYRQYIQRFISQLT